MQRKWKSVRLRVVFDRRQDLGSLRLEYHHHEVGRRDINDDKGVARFAVVSCIIIPSLVT